MFFLGKNNIDCMSRLRNILNEITDNIVNNKLEHNRGVLKKRILIMIRCSKRQQL
jgi:hypothetical protein